MTIEKLPANLGVPEVKGLPPLDLGPALTMLRDKINELIDWANSPARAIDPIGSFMESLSPSDFSDPLAGAAGQLPEETARAVYDPAASIPAASHIEPSPWRTYEPPRRYGDQGVEAVIEGSSHEHTLWVNGDRVVVETNPGLETFERRRQNGWECLAAVIGPPSVQIELGDVARNALDAAQDVRQVVRAWFNDMIIRKHTKREVILFCSCGRVLGGGRCNVCDNDE